MTDARARFSPSWWTLPGLARPLAAIVVSALALGLTACQSKNDLEPSAAGTGRPAAAFTQGATTGTPGLVVQFTDGSSGEITDWAWDFGAAGKRSERSPQVQFDDPGVYTVSLTVSGPGGSSTVTKSALVEVDEPATAGFDCLPTAGFAPLTVACTDASVGATRYAWSFGDGGTSTEASPIHVFDTAGHFTVTQTASSAGGSDTATATIDVYPISITTTPASGTLGAPATVTLRANVGGLHGIAIWSVDGQVVGSSTTEIYTFLTPGTHRITLVFGDTGAGLVGQTEVDYVVGYGPATADFAPTPAEGPGPMTVTLQDLSSGAITRWDWDFGDGSRCTWPAPTPAGSVPACNAASPTHVYSDIGSYDVRLAVTGPGATTGSPAVTSTKTTPDAVRVLILDAGFEAQTANAKIGGAWTHLRPQNELTAATHVALTKTPGGSDGAMPTEGSKWAVLDGLGTSGTTAVASIENGIAQTFLRPVSNTVLEFDYALLFAEPPAGSVRDAVTATVTDVDSGVTVEIPSARTDSGAAYQGTSARYPTRDGSAMRATPTFTAAIDLAAAFPSSTPDSRFTLTIRVANAVNAFRSPRAYVDNVRFSAPAAPQTAAFAAPGNPIVAGRDVVFTDESCLSPATTGCEVPTSWRWDFGTSRLATPPASSGSREQSPTYRFPAPGVYDVRLRVARADQESVATLSLTVVGGPVASFTTAETAPFTAPATLHFQDTSSFDPGDPIVAWSWDFGGFGTSSLANPGAVTIGQAGSWTIRLQITTQSGQTSLAETVLTVE
ncbi:MAG: PKD domain-containing protein [Myxococcota bacterium]